MSAEWCGPKLNFPHVMDGLEFLNRVEDETVDVSFFDPQYRGVLDWLQHSNEKENRSKRRSALTQMDEAIIKQFIKEINRVLKSSCHLFLWVDKFHLCEGVKHWTEKTSLKIVDMVVWDKMSMKMGYRTRRQSEYCLVLQKPPILAKAIWTDHSIPDVWQERAKEGDHPHMKPVILQSRLIAAVTDLEAIVLDPAAGSFSVLSSARISRRNFLGCDIEKHNFETHLL